MAKISCIKVLIYLWSYISEYGHWNKVLPKRPMVDYQLNPGWRFEHIQSNVSLLKFAGLRNPGPANKIVWFWFPLFSGTFFVEILTPMLTCKCKFLHPLFPPLWQAIRPSRWHILSLKMHRLLCHRAVTPPQSFTARKKPYFEEVVNLASIVGLINLFLHFEAVICNMDTVQHNYSGWHLNFSIKKKIHQHEGRC